MTAEEWRPCQPHPAYQVSNLGRVRSPRGVILRPWANPRGYLYVDLGRKCRARSVHNLVADAWLTPRPAGAEPDHIDHDRTNNTAANLRWLHRLVNAVRWADRVGGRNVWETPDDVPERALEPLSPEERAELERSLEVWAADSRAPLAGKGAVA